MGVFIVRKAPVVPGSALFVDNYDTGSRAGVQNGISYGAVEAVANSITVVNDRSTSGAYSLRYRYVSAGAGEQNLQFATPINQFWMRYNFYVPSNYNHPGPIAGNNNKFWLAIWGNSDGEYGDPSTPGMDINLYPKADTNTTGESDGIVFYFTRPMAEFDYSSESALGYEGANGGFPAIRATDFGQWMTMTFYAYTAANASTPGGMKVWKRAGMSGPHTLICDSISTRTNSNLVNYLTGQTGWTNMYLMGYCNSGYATTTDFYIDDMQIAGSDIWGDLS